LISLQWFITRVLLVIISGHLLGARVKAGEGAALPAGRRCSAATGWKWIRPESHPTASRRFPRPPARVLRAVL